MGEEVAAVIVLRPGHVLEAEEINRHVARHLARFEMPTRIFFRAEHSRAIRRAKCSSANFGPRRRRDRAFGLVAKCVERVEGLVVERDSGGGAVLLHVGHLGGPGNRQQDRGTAQQPRERELSDGDAVLVRQRVERTPLRARLPAATGNQGMNPMPSPAQYSNTASLCRFVTL